MPFQRFKPAVTMFDVSFGVESKMLDRPPLERIATEFALSPQIGHWMICAETLQYRVLECMAKLLLAAIGQFSATPIIALLCREFLAVFWIQLYPIGVQTPHLR